MNTAQLARRLLPFRRAGALALALAAAGLFPARAARGSAFVDAFAESWDYPPGVTVSDQHTGTFGPVTASAGGSNGNASGSASVSIETFNGKQHIGLHAQGQASAPSSASSEVPLPNGGGTAQWIDELHANNDDLTQVSLGQTYFTFTPSLEGSTSGESTGSLEVELLGTGKSLSASGELRFTLPVTTFGLTSTGQVVDNFLPVPLSMTLQAHALALPGGSASADFSHTALLNVYLSDAAGNPLAAPPHISLVGESGTYDLQPLPEPTTALALVIPIALLSRRRRVRR
jgi:hypothetical protein